MIKIGVYLACMVLAASAAPQNAPTEAAEATTTEPPPPEVVEIISNEFEVDAINGSFKYSFESGDGTKAEQSGILRNVSDDKAGEAVQGSFEYTDPDGNVVSISYTADENGYRPSGDVLPTPPPIPAAIARALKYLAEHPYVEESEKRANNSESSPNSV